MLKRVLLTGFMVFGLSTPADAALVRLQFSGEIDQYNSYQSSLNPDSAYSAGQLNYLSGIHIASGLIPGSMYDFVIQYDSDTAAVGGRYAFDLVSGYVGSNTDFSDFTPYAIFQAAGAYTYLNFVLEKNTGPGGTQPIYAILNIGDNDGDVVSGVLPSVVIPSNIDFKNASFEARGAYVSSQYRSIYDSASLAVLPAGAIGATGGVPEPTAWTMMILGFGLAGAGLRRVRPRASGGSAKPA